MMARPMEKLNKVPIRVAYNVAKKINPIYALRPMAQDVYKRAKKSKEGFVGVEIGVFKGENAYNMLTSIPIKHLYLIDPYEAFVQHDIPKDFSRFYEEAKARLEPFKDKITFIKKLSYEAASEIPDNLDFVYIDGNHDYDFVKKDIELYFPKVKSGGIVGGHDFVLRYPYVCQAVAEFRNKNKDLIKELWSFEQDWWYIKK